MNLVKLRWPGCLRVKNLYSANNPTIRMTKNVPKIRSAIIPVCYPIIESYFLCCVFDERRLAVLPTTLNVYGVAGIGVQINGPRRVGGNVLHDHGRHYPTSP